MAEVRGSRFKAGTAHGESNLPLLKVLPPQDGEAGYRGLFRCLSTLKDGSGDPCPHVFEARIALVRNNNTSSCGCQRFRPVPSARKATKHQLVKAAEIVAAAPPAEKYVPKKIAAKGEGLGRKENRRLKREAEAKAKRKEERAAKKSAPAKKKTAAKKAPATATKPVNSAAKKAAAKKKTAATGGSKSAQMTALKKQLNAGEITDKQFNARQKKILAS